MLANYYKSQTSDVSLTIIAAWVRLFAPSFPNIAVIWAFTVALAIDISKAISLFSFPLAMYFRIRDCCGVKLEILCAVCSVISLSLRLVLGMRKSGGIYMLPFQISYSVFCKIAQGIFLGMKPATPTARKDAIARLSAWPEMIMIGTLSSRIFSFK